MIGQDYNCARFRAGMAGGHYESYFQRANHPTRPLAFWIRYTVFSPRGRPQAAIGELWAVAFNGETGRHVAAKTEVPIADCAFSPGGLDVRIATARLSPVALAGEAGSADRRIKWNLGYSTPEPPLFSMDPPLYGWPVPKAKSLVGGPLAEYQGQLAVNGEAIPVDGWKGSQNHNWGSAHTDEYAYGQVAGFDNAPDSFLELATGRLKYGGIWTPYMTPLVLRHEGQEYALNSIAQAIFRARGRFRFFDWQFRSERDGLRVEGEIRAPREAFVGLRYYNPPGGEKHCLNSKIASCRLTLTRPGKSAQVLETQHRAAFEILTDDRAHGVVIAA